MINKKLFSIVLTILFIVSLIMNGAFYWLLKKTDLIAGGQNTIVQVLESKLKSSSEELSLNHFHEEIKKIFPKENIIFKENSIEVCGAIFHFKNGEYFGSSSAL